MRGTRSRDGRRRVTLRHEERLGREELIVLLANYAARLYDIDDLDEGGSPVPRGNMTRARAERMIREAARSRPDPLDRWEWYGDLGDDERAEIIQTWATIMVDSLFPDVD